MTLQTTQSVIGWCLAINVARLIFWFLVFVLAHDIMYRTHAKLFKLSVETFDALHYAGLVVYKLMIIIFNIARYLAIRLSE